MQTVFINSYMRSGSTLLGMLLSKSFATPFLGEMRNAEELFSVDMTCVCGKPLSQCTFWQPVLSKHGPIAKTKQVSRLGTWPVLAFGLTVGRLGSAGEAIAKVLPPMRKEMSGNIEIMKMLASIEAVHAPKAVIDSSHRTVQMILMREILGKRMKTVWLVRDGRAVAASLQRRQGFSIEKGALSEVPSAETQLRLAPERRHRPMKF